jgi:hypothetical protein
MLLEVEPITFSYEMIFRECVDILSLVAAIFDTTYEAANIWIFCIIWPFLFLVLIIWNIYLRRRLRSLRMILKSKPITDNLDG